MAKRRTKKDKIIAKLRRQAQSNIIPKTQKLSYPSAKISNKSAQKIQHNKKEEKSLDDLFFYDPQLIRKDLLRTVMLVAFIFIIEFGLYLSLR